MSQQHDIRIYGDTTMCSKCGKQWDTNDPYPPDCLENADEQVKNLKRMVSELETVENNNEYHLKIDTIINYIKRM